MSAGISAQKATEELRQNPAKFKDPESLRRLASQVDADAPGRLTVLYSGRVTELIGSNHVIEAMIERRGDIRAINKSQAALFLNGRDFGVALSAAFGAPHREILDGTYRGPATDWLYHPTEGPWADASARFANATVGEVRAIVSHAQPNRVFGEIELPRILANPNVTTIEGIPREALLGVGNRHGRQAAFEVIVARAFEHVGMLRIPAGVDDLRDWKNVLRVDTRDYLRGTPLVGHSVIQDDFTLPMSARMLSDTEHARAGRRRWDEWHGRDTLVAQAAGVQRVSRGGVAVGIAGLGAAATAYEVAETARRYRALRAQDNLTAARSEVFHAAAQGAGGWAGGTLATALVGSSGAGPVALVMADAYLFSAAADKAVARWDHRQVYTQSDRNGIRWDFNGQQWLRQERADLRDDGVDRLQDQAMFALPEKARELNHLASVIATEQALGRVQARFPYAQPAGAMDVAHVYARDWQLDPASGQWSRRVADAVDRNDRPVWTAETADPQRAAMLNQQASRVIDANIAHGAAAIAATYQAGPAQRLG